MAAMDFPASPTEGQTYVSPSGPTYIFRSGIWTTTSSSGAVVYISDTPPPTPTDNSLWWHATSGVLSVRYRDADSAQWVTVLGASTDPSKVSKSGDTMTGDLTISKAAPTLVLDKTAAAQTDGIYGKLNGVNRWLIATPNATAESGSNTGSNFQIVRYTDAGAAIDAPLSIDRASGTTTLTGDLTVAKAHPALILNAPASGDYNVIFGQIAAKARWAIIPGNGAAESTGNAGSHFQIDRYSDAGTGIDTPFSINRATGIVTAKGLPAAPANGAGVMGLWTSQGLPVNTAAVLPAGGTWAWFSYGLNATGATTTQIWSGAAAGGTAVLGATAGVLWHILYWRIA